MEHHLEHHSELCGSIQWVWVMQPSWNIIGADNSLKHVSLGAALVDFFLQGWICDRILRQGTRLSAAHEAVIHAKLSFGVWLRVRYRQVYVSASTPPIMNKQYVFGSRDGIRCHVPSRLGAA